MAFKIVAKPRAWWPVTWPGVTEDGRIIENAIEMRFMLLKVDDRDALEEEIQERLLASARAKAAGDDVKSSALMRDALQLFADDWRGVHAENDDPLPWSDENVRLLMNEPNVFERTLAAYRVCMAGGQEIREGN